MTVEVPVRNLGESAQAVILEATIYNAEGNAVAVASSSSPTDVSARGGTATLSAVATLSAPALWSIGRPYLYTVAVALLDGGERRGAQLDAINVTLGLKHAVFDADQGLMLNGQPIKLRGFCDHDNWGGVGAAVPDRINLFRAQGLRAVSVPSPGPSTHRRIHASAHSLVPPYGR